jgi:FMN phosphatase YigB (HAD superfamily)
MNSKVVFFDVGGTLVDPPDLFETVTRKLTGKSSDKAVYDSIRDVFSQVYGEWEKRDRFLSIEDMLAITMVRVAQAKQLPDISNEVHGIYREVFFERIRIFPEAVGVLDKLRKHKVKMVVASDADAGLIEAQFTKLDIGKYFTDRCLSGTVQAYKPSERFTRHLLKHISGREESYFVGDNWVDVESGKQLGIKSVHVDRRGIGNKFQADYCISNLEELPSILGLD